jgi:hypothetical protein
MHPTLAHVVPAKRSSISKVLAPAFLAVRSAARPAVPAPIIATSQLRSAINRPFGLNKSANAKRGDDGFCVELLCGRAAIIHPSSDRRSGKRGPGVNQSLLFKLGPEFEGNFALQRIVILGDLLMASRSDDKSDRDIWRCRELKRSCA